MLDTILEGDHPRIISEKFGWDWLSSFRGEDFFLISSPLFSILSLSAFLVWSRDHWTQFWKGATEGPFHQRLVAIGPVVSEEKIKMWNVDGRTKSDGNSSHGLKARWAKKLKNLLVLGWRNGAHREDCETNIATKNHFYADKLYNFKPLPVYNIKDCYTINQTSIYYRPWLQVKMRMFHTDQEVHTCPHHLSITVHIALWGFLSVLVCVPFEGISFSCSITFLYYFSEFS